MLSAELMSCEREGERASGSLQEILPPLLFCNAHFFPMETTASGRESVVCRASGRASELERLINKVRHNGPELRSVVGLCPGGRRTTTTTTTTEEPFKWNFGPRVIEFK